MTPRFLSFEDVERIHRRQLEKFGGRDGLRDRNLLESAIGMPQQTFDGAFVHVDLFEMAAAYTFHIAQGQCFIDGNKRTGLVAALAFLALNGDPVRTADDRLYDAMIAIAERTRDKPGLAALLRELARG